MDTIVIIIIASVVSILVGALISSTILKNSIMKKSQHILKEAKSEAEMIKKDRILEAKEKFLQLKSEHEKHINDKNNDITNRENRLRQKETAFSQRMEEISKKQKELTVVKDNMTAQLEIVNKKQAELEKASIHQIEQLEIISGMSAADAKAQLVENLKTKAKSEVLAQIKDIVDEAKLTANMEAKKIIIETIQRNATEHASENAVSVFNIENDEIKGRIIGREGRNIRALEAATGVEIIVDDTPEAIILSAFDPIRREIARLSLHKLVSDGRIHPARIEEVVSKVKKQIEQEIIEIGKRTTIDLGVHGIHHELIRLIGKMKYRSSYG